eukprot:COSAG02_NODE_1432_length_12646_cov_3.566988_10_plen_117_part_00
MHGWTARQLGWRKCGSAEAMSTAAAAARGPMHADELACEDDMMYATIATRYLTSLYWAMQVRICTVRRNELRWTLSCYFQRHITHAAVSASATRLTSLCNVQTVTTVGYGDIVAWT